MLSREDFYMIKQMRQQGAYIVDIATQVGCSERTVRHYLKYPEPPARKTRHKMAKLKPFMDYIDTRLAENVWNGEVILAEIKAMGYTGGRSMLRHYIQPKRKMRPSKKTVRFETQPGHQLQHDWGEVDVEVAGQRCKVNFAVNTLGFSRRFHVFAAQKQDAEHTYESLVRAFRNFGGSVKTVLVDNQKAAVLKNNDGKVVFNSGFLLLADHYDFLPRACRLRRARTKGKVERMVKYLKENFFVRYRRFDSLAHVNQQLEQWMVDVADKRELRQFRQTPEQRFAASAAVAGYGLRYQLLRYPPCVLGHPSREVVMPILNSAAADVSQSVPVPESISPRLLYVLDDIVNSCPVLSLSRC